VKGKITHLDLVKAQEAFDYILTVDTNSKMFGDEQVSVTAATFYEVEKSKGGEVGNLNPLTRVVIEFRGATKNPERIGWWLMLKRLPTILDGPKRVGVVVDSYLGSLRRLNTREEPVLGNYFLPEGCELIYASDKGTDTGFNPALRKCDNQANDILEWTRNHDTPDDFVTDDGAPYRVRRTWRTDAIQWIFERRLDPAALPGMWYVPPNGAHRFSYMWNDPLHPF
jgi:hypothetical protein